MTTAVYTAAPLLPCCVSLRRCVVVRGVARPVSSERGGELADNTLRHDISDVSRETGFRSARPFWGHKLLRNRVGWL